MTINDQVLPPAERRGLSPWSQHRYATKARALAAAMDVPADAAWLEALADRLDARSAHAVGTQFTARIRVDDGRPVHAWSPPLGLSLCGRPMEERELLPSSAAITCGTCLRTWQQARHDDGAAS